MLGFCHWGKPVKAPYKTLSLVVSFSLLWHSVQVSANGTCSSLVLVSEFWESVLIPDGVDLFQLRQQEIEDYGSKHKRAFRTMPQALLEKLKKAPASRYEKRAPWVSQREAYDLWREGLFHPVTGFNNVRKYDPDGNIGFCFGKATAVHWLALLRGLAPDSVFKIWAVGNLKVPGMVWKFHVATVVRGEPEGNDESSWLVIDPNYQFPVSLAFWIKGLQRMDRDGSARFYLTSANRFLAGSALEGGRNFSSYRSGGLYQPYYNGYFRDLADFLAEELSECRRGLRSKSSSCIPFQSFPRGQSYFGEVLDWESNGRQSRQSITGDTLVDFLPWAWAHLKAVLPRSVFGG